MSEDIPDWLKERHAERQRRHDQLSSLKAALIAALKRRKIARVTVEYDGEGDSGQTGNITAKNKADEVVELQGDMRLPLERNEVSLGEAIDIFTWDVLAVYHDGFVNNDGGFGTITIDVAEGTVSLDHNDRMIELSNTVTEV